MSLSMGQAIKVLHVAAEAYPLVKTGGLADVLAGLPQAQVASGADVRLLLPGYPAVLAGVEAARVVADIGPVFGALKARVLLARMPSSAVPVYVIDAPYLYRRSGSPYENAEGLAWQDNAQRFTLLSWLAAHLAAGDVDDDWTPDVVHAHDWHAALTPAFMAAQGAAPAKSVFTIHNLAFQGQFPLADAALLGLPSHQLTAAGMEFHGQLSFMKAGLVYADHITTVSPRYAQEIATPELGCGLDGVLRSCGAKLTGILNGIDAALWNPATDKALAHCFDAHALQGKQASKCALQMELGLMPNSDAMLLTVVSRLTSQKGLDLVLQAMPELMKAGVQFAIQGTGEGALQVAFKAMQHAHPEQVSVYIGYDEGRAHRLIAGADVIAVPSRFEPCGLTQLYGQRYGTLPIVRSVGGLTDTVVDATPDQRAANRASGFTFEAATSAAFEGCVLRALACWRNPNEWAHLTRHVMALDRSWAGPAQQYLALYERLVGRDVQSGVG